MGGLGMSYLAFFFFLALDTDFKPTVFFRDQICCLDLNTSWPNASQVAYLLYYLSGPGVAFFTALKNFFLSMEGKPEKKSLPK